MGLPSEAALQQALLPRADLFVVANRYYVYVHFPLTLLFLLWGYFGRSIAEYRWARNLLVVQTFLALGVHVIFPLAWLRRACFRIGALSTR